jgi:sterol desaturase/sphingolipid hydroxylase (fatty acid hydroxylase superfamily)
VDYRLVVTLIFVGFAVVELVAGRLLYVEETTRDDVLVELGSALLPIAIVPGILTATAVATAWVAQGSQGALAAWPAWLMFVTLIVADDLMQYTWHRLAHSHPLLFRFHRAHHSAQYLCVRVVFRNSLLYYAMLPGLWFSGVLLYLGFAPVYYVYYIVKMVVIIGAHSSVAWDEHLARVPGAKPVVWLLQRVISTPTTHAAHHGRNASDGVTHYKGNYGNFLFLWDVLFGTAKISDRRPDAYGLEDVEPEPWHRELLWPWRAR